MRRRLAIGLLVAVLVAVGIGLLVMRSVRDDRIAPIPAIPTSVPAPATTTPLVSGGTIAVYASTELGSEESLAELDRIKVAGFDSVIAYGSMNGRTVAGIRRYLDEARRVGIDVVFSVKDVLGTTDTDDVNAEHHRRLFKNGQDQSTDAQVETIARELLGHPSVKRVLISDELPGDLGDLQEWLPRLKMRYEQINKIKPVSVVLYWNPDSSDFYRAVKQYTHDLQIDYYPLPESNKYGPVSAIADIGQMLWQTAGEDGWFVLQAFGWDPEAHSEAADLGFTKRSPPPTVEQMVDMVRRAVEGHGEGGAMNIAFYALGDPNAASLDAMAEAIRRIRAADWWQNRGN